MPPDKENNQGDLLVELDDDQLGLFDEPASKPDDAAPVEKPKRTRKAAAPPAEDDAEAIRKRYETDLETERQARLAAEARAAEREAELAEARKRQTEVEGDVISNAKAAAQAQLKQLKADLAKAHNEGEYDKLGDIHEALARASAILLRLDGDEADHKERASATPAEPAQKAQAPASSTQADYDAFLKTLPARARQLFIDDPDLFHNKGNFALVNGAHAAAVARGIKFDTDDYYNFITKRLPDFDDHDDGDDDVDDDTPRRAAAAPVSREPVRSGTRRPGEPRGEYLTAEERAFCDESGVSYKEYAAEKLKIKKGHYA